MQDACWCRGPVFRPNWAHRTAPARPPDSPGFTMPSQPRPRHASPNQPQSSKSSRRKLQASSLKGRSREGLWGASTRARAEDAGPPGLANIGGRVVGERGPRCCGCRCTCTGCTETTSSIERVQLQSASQTLALANCMFFCFLGFWPQMAK